MTTISLLMYLGSNILIAGATAYFFYRVLSSPPSTDGHEENVPTRKTFDAT